MNNYLSKSYLIILLLNHVRYLIKLCIYFSHSYLSFMYHSIETKITLSTALQFKFQASLKLSDVSKPQLIKNQRINIFFNFKIMKTRAHEFFSNLLDVFI